MKKADIRQVFADRLREAMKAKGMTQAALAVKAGTSQGYISELLNLVSAPTIETLGDLAEALDVLPWELLLDTEEARKAAWSKVMGFPEPKGRKNHK